jgi:hypothetical protein
MQINSEPAPAPLRSRNAELGQMRPQCIDQLGTLAHQQIARSMLHQPALLLGRLDPHKAYGRTSDRLADRLGVGGIVLVALDVSLYILRRHQTNLVTELRQLACPMVRRGTGLHADEARRQRFEERITRLRRSCFLTMTFSAASIP